MMNGILWALLGTLFTFSVTTLGALNVYWVRGKITERVQCVFLGFAGGVMVAASVWSLLLPAIERAETLDQTGWLVTTTGFLLGVVSLLAADVLFRKHYMRRLAGGGISSLKQRTLMMIAAITIHNIPEGMAVGLAFAMAASDMGNPALFSGAVALAVGIGIQNYPEGTAVALPLHSDGMSKKKAALYGSMSASVEPVFGVLAAVLAVLVTPLMPLFLSYAAGTMIYVVIQELMPEAHMGEGDKTATLSFVAGFLVMMILDVSLG
ncbi:MAG: ZIP family metal transporter [Firmicutes bacterium]|nr:ZIP family metal transporter [Bacillota bacterium]